MRKIKLIAIALVMALAGFVYAFAQAQNKREACSMDKGACCAAECCKAENSCCKEGAACCKDGAACCKAEGKKAAHKTEKGHASCACCEGENSCCKADKSGKMQMKEGACDMSKDGAACCDSGCCGASCCAKEKGKTS